MIILYIAIFMHPHKSKMDVLLFHFSERPYATKTYLFWKQRFYRCIPLVCGDRAIISSLFNNKEVMSRFAVAADNNSLVHSTGEERVYILKSQQAYFHEVFSFSWYFSISLFSFSFHSSNILISFSFSVSIFLYFYIFDHFSLSLFSVSQSFCFFLF